MFTLITVVYIFLVYTIIKNGVSFNTIKTLGIQSEKLAKLLMFFIFTTTLITINGVFLRKILNEKIPENIARRGRQGTKGIRGETGKSGICESCNDDANCYKKIIRHITSTINWWRTKIKKLKPLEESYLIKNEYIKSKVKRHCKSEEFLKILNKFGANQKDPNICPKNVNPCGAYDYMFRVWSIWILIILKYDNGFFFLENPKMNENDFISLLEKVDNNPLPEGLNQWNNMFEDNKGEKLFIKKNVTLKKNGEKYTSIVDFETDNIHEKFFSTLGVPKDSNDKILSPFEEIKKYKSWYWGSDPALLPKLTIIPKTENINDTHSLCNTCVNFWKEGNFTCKDFNLDENKKGRIKILKTNNFYKVFSTDVAMQTKTDSVYTPFQLFGSKEVTFMRANNYVDENIHFMFSEYKPVGDVVFDSSLVRKYAFESDACMPNNINYNKNLIDRIVDKEMSSILVSGDVKHPKDYKLIFTTSTRNGINANISCLSIWKPIPPEDYVALGFVVDTMPYIEDFGPNKPPFDRIVCVPKDCVEQNNEEQIFFWDNDYKNLEGELENLCTVFKSNEESSEYKLNTFKSVETYDINGIKNNQLSRYFKENIFYNIKPDTICIEYDKFKHSSDDIKIEVDSCKNKKNKIDCENDINCSYDDNTQKCGIQDDYDELKKYSIMSIYDKK